MKQIKTEDGTFITVQQNVILAIKMHFGNDNEKLTQGNKRFCLVHKEEHFMLSLHSFSQGNPEGEF